MSSERQLEYFVNLVLNAMPEAERRSPDVTLRFFQHLERSDTHMYQYRVMGGEVNNSQIAQVIKEHEGRENDKEGVPAKNCSLIQNYTRFKPLS